MKSSLEKFLEQVIPFFIIGVAVALLVAIAIMLSYVLVWGVVIGAILWGIVWVKDFFTVKNKDKKTEGRIIEHDDK